MLLYAFLRFNAVKLRNYDILSPVIQHSFYPALSMLSVICLIGNSKDLNQAWDLYYHVFRRIVRQLPQLTTLELHYVSPNLLKCQNLELAVPGSYAPGQPVVRIAYFQSSLEVGPWLPRCSSSLQLSYRLFWFKGNYIEATPSKADNSRQ